MNLVDPPAIVAIDPALSARCDAFAARFKLAKQPLVVFLRDNLYELELLHEALVPRGLWRNFLKRIGVPKSTAHRWLSSVPNGTSETVEVFEQDDDREVDALTGTANACAATGIQTSPSQSEVEAVVENGPAELPKGWKKCGLCKSKPSRDSSKCPECVKLNAKPATPPLEEPEPSKDEPILDPKFGAYIKSLSEAVDLAAKRAGYLKPTPVMTGFQRMLEEFAKGVRKWANELKKQVTKDREAEANMFGR